jgi:hypothetical protein
VNHFDSLEVLSPQSPPSAAFEVPEALSVTVVGTCGESKACCVLQLSLFTPMERVHAQVRAAFGQPPGHRLELSSGERALASAGSLAACLEGVRLAEGLAVRLALPAVPTGTVSPYRAPMTISVKPINGHAIELDVEGTDTVGSLKDKITEVHGIPHFRQRLIIAGRHLEDGRTLDDCNIRHGARVHLVLRLRGNGHDHTWDGTPFGPPLSTRQSPAPRSLLPDPSTEGEPTQRERPRGSVSAGYPRRAPHRDIDAAVRDRAKRAAGCGAAGEGRGAGAGPLRGCAGPHFGLLPA